MGVQIGGSTFCTDPHLLFPGLHAGYLKKSLNQCFSICGTGLCATPLMLNCILPHSNKIILKGSA